MLLGFCLIAILCSIAAFQNAKKGKKYTSVLLISFPVCAKAQKNDNDK